MKHKPYFLAGACMLCIALTASAQLYLNEDFEYYTVGYLAGQAGGQAAYARSWKGNDQTKVVAGDAGNYLRVEASGNWTGVALNFTEPTSPFYGMSGVLGADPGSVLYLSFYIEFETIVVKNAQAMVALSEAFGSENGLLFGQMWNQWNFSGAFGQPSSEELDEERHFVLIELRRNGGGAISAKVFLDSVSQSDLPLAAQKPAMTLWPKEKDLRFLAFKANTNAFLVDQIKIGGSINAVFNQY